MRDDDRRRRQESDEELFSSLLGEIETVQTDAGKDAGGSVFSDPHERDLGPRTAPPSPTGGAAAPAGGAGPTYSASSLADENLGDLPTLGPTGGRRAANRLAGATRLGGRRPPRLLLLAVAVILGGAAWMFWPHGQPEPPLGIGERTSVVTRDGARTTPPAATSDVDIAAETRVLVPEGGTPPAPPAGSPAGSPRPAATRPSASAEAAAGVGAETSPRGPAPAATRHETGGDAREQPAAASAAFTETAGGPPGAGETAAAGPAVAAPTVSESAVSEPAAGASLAGEPAASQAAAGPAPGPDGLWALQLGAFQAQENADKLAGELRGRGLQPMIKTAATSSGGLMYKVWIGYFASRAEAAAYAQRQARLLGGQAQPVHR